jgi:uncharacterized protein
MPINAHPEYLAAQKEYLAAQTPEERLEALENMISLAPSHKGAENLRSELKTRYKKLKEKLEKGKKAGKSTKASIKKEEMQAVIIGFTGSGKSTLLNNLTNVKTQVGDFAFTTRNSVVGVMDYHGSKVQIIEIPAVESEYYDRGLANSADVVIVLITELKQLEEIKKYLERTRGKKIIAFNKIDSLSENEIRKINATLQSKKLDFVMISGKEKQNLPELKDKIFRCFGKIRVYTKEPGKQTDRNRPLILGPEADVRDVAEKILKGFSSKIKETRIWGPSSKFPGQKVGLKHRVKDMDVVEFKTI